MDRSFQINYEALGEIVSDYELDIRDRVSNLQNIAYAARLLNDTAAELKIRSIGIRCDDVINKLNDTLRMIEKLDPKEGQSRFNQIDNEFDSIDAAVENTATILEARLRIRGHSIDINRKISRAAIGAGLLYYFTR